MITISISVCAADILSLYPCIISFTPYGLVYIHTVYVLCIVYRLRYIRNVEMLYKGCYKKTTLHFFLLIINIIMKFISQFLLYRMVGLHGSKIYKILVEDNVAVDFLTRKAFKLTVYKTKNMEF